MSPALDDHEKPTVPVVPNPGAGRLSGVGIALAVSASMRTTTADRSAELPPGIATILKRGCSPNADHPWHVATSISVGQQRDRPGFLSLDRASPLAPARLPGEPIGIPPRPRRRSHGRRALGPTMLLDTEARAN